MRVMLCPADNSGCGIYRLRQPAKILAEQELTVEIVINDEALHLKENNGRITGVDPIDVDVLVLQRPLHWWAPQAIPFYQRQGVKVVVEVDDDFHSIHPWNGAYPTVHPKTSPGFNWHHLRKACSLADLVTVSTPALASVYAGRRCAILPNYVSERLTHLPSLSDGRTVGWAGVVGSHPDDLQVTRGGVAQAVSDTGSRFLAVGNGELVRKHLGLNSDPEVTGWLTMDDLVYYRSLTRLDVGIVPLSDTRFNAAKSWLKGLEYAACGVPFVASPVAEYARLAEDYGLGTLASGSRARAWRQAVGALMGDSWLRADLAERGRRIVREHLSIERHAWRWAEAWASTMERAVAA